MIRRFKCTIQDEPFGRRWFLAGKSPTHLRAVPIHKASQYSEAEIVRFVKKARETFPGSIITVL